MGRAIDRERFDDGDFQRFSERLRRCLEALGELLRRPGFGEGPTTIGSELELFLIDPSGRPLPVNQKVLDETIDPRLTYELDRFNVECNLTPLPLEGRPFSALGAEMERVLAEVRRAARTHRGRVAVVGILPTFVPEDLQSWVMTDVPRYKALSASLHRRHPEPFRVEIDGADPLYITCDDVTFEGANTSLQIHLRVSPLEFTPMYNAVQMATAPAVAVAGNSPTFLGHRLWEETRVALFKQSVDARPEVEGRRKGPGRVTFGHRWVRGGALELFTDLVDLYEPLLPMLNDQEPLECVRSGGVPGLDELRTHNGTVWRWNRPVYDPGEGGHLRIEMRALPAGPTVADMAANTAFFLGLTLGLAPRTGAWSDALPFEPAHTNFYRAAQFGLDADLSWELEAGAGLTTIRARDLVLRLLPVARKGLESAGVEAGEASGLLDVIETRARSGQTGAVWQRQVLEQIEPRLGRKRALAAMFERYLECAQGGEPVHRWPLG